MKFGEPKERKYLTCDLIVTRRPDFWNRLQYSFYSKDGLRVTTVFWDVMERVWLNSTHDKSATEVPPHVIRNLFRSNCK